jgi:glycerate kinase
MRILVAPQEFKGTLTASEAAEAIARGLRRAIPGADIDLLPVADGGPGTVDALVDATGGTLQETEVEDPLGRPVRATWGAQGDGETAVIEMAAASGLTLLKDGERDPRRASTYGTGQLIRAALDSGYRTLLIGAGGSATNDGGAGVAVALGARLLDAQGRDLDRGGAPLAGVEHIDVGSLDPRLRDADVSVLVDVQNPLCGADGASLVYGAQKGATDAIANELDAALSNYARVVRRDLGVDIKNVPGAGAAGGLAAGLIAFCGAKVRPGFDAVADAIGFDERVASVDAAVTGEGRLDAQTSFGKATAGVARRARAASKPVVAVAGSIVGRGASEMFDAVVALVPDVSSEDEALSSAAAVLERGAERAGRELRGLLA